MFLCCFFPHDPFHTISGNTPPDSQWLSGGEFPWSVSLGGTVASPRHYSKHQRRQSACYPIKDHGMVIINSNWQHDGATFSLGDLRAQRKTVPDRKLLVLGCTPSLWQQTAPPLILSDLLLHWFYVPNQAKDILLGPKTLSWPVECLNVILWPFNFLDKHVLVTVLLFHWCEEIEQTV